MTKQEITSQLEQFVREIAELVDNQDVLLGSKLNDDLGVDSLMLVDLVVRAERHYKIMIDESEVAKMNTFGDYCASVCDAIGVVAA